MIKEYPSRSAFYECLPKNAVGCEVGVMGGENAQLILGAATPREFHLIDLWEGHSGDPKIWRKYKRETKKRLAKHISRGTTRLHEGRVEEILPTFGDSYFDFAYVDAHHDYENVSRHLQLAIKAVKIGGVIAGHDFAVKPFLSPGVEGWKTGVCRAVIEVIQAGAGPMIALSNKHFADYAIRLEKKVDVSG